MKIWRMSSLAFKELFLKCKHPLNCIHHPKAVVFSSVSPWTNAYTTTASFQIKNVSPPYLLESSKFYYNRTIYLTFF